MENGIYISDEFKVKFSDNSFSIYEYQGINPKTKEEIWTFRWDYSTLEGLAKGILKHCIRRITKEQKIEYKNLAKVIRECTDEILNKLKEFM